MTTVIDPGATTRQRVARVHLNETVSIRRIGAMVLRHLYVITASWPRIIELTYWPTMQMLMWGFTTQFFLTHSSWLVQAAGALIAGVLLWDVLFRSQLGLSLSFFEEIWSRNLGSLFVSPLRVHEFATELMIMSLIRCLVGILPAALLAIPLYHYSIFDMGLPLCAFFCTLLVTGWAVGLMICALIFRWGQGAEGMAWGAVFALAPISGVYYPIETLPGWLQPVSWALPSAYVFEGMRAALIDQVFRIDLMAAAQLLNLLYLVVGAGAFFWAFEDARRRGKLLQQGE
ncbi:MAG: ABC transporter permease [Alphaproteobacteria bacterium]|nr:ABC transporter permease [Alphaproteobacteria bacterium]